MTLKLIGAVLVFTGCGGFGFSMAAAHRREERELRQYLLALTYMEGELSYQMTSLPELCRSAAAIVTGPVHTLLLALTEELDAQTGADARMCMQTALAQRPDLPQSLRELLLELGQTLGQFDLPGQLRSLRSAMARTEQALSVLADNREQRLRSYQTLGLCAGAALAILFL